MICLHILATLKIIADISAKLHIVQKCAKILSFIISVYENGTLANYNPTVLNVVYRNLNN